MTASERALELATVAARAAAAGHTFDSALAEASALLSGVSRAAGVVVTTKSNAQLKHIEFVRLDATQGMAILVGQDPGLRGHPGLAALVGETVGDEERAAYLDKV